MRSRRTSPPDTGDDWRTRESFLNLIVTKVSREERRSWPALDGIQVVLVAPHVCYRTLTYSLKQNVIWLFVATRQFVGARLYPLRVM
jgi:hypothetical protein